MEILNRITLKKELAKPEKVKRIVLTVRQKGVFGMSEGLWEMLGRPGYVEFRYDGLELYIVASDEDRGFKVFASLKARNYSFCCKPVQSRFFVSGSRHVVFTDPVENEGEALYQVKL